MLCINGDNCFKVLDNPKLVLFYFTANWCGPCKKISPLVDRLISRMPANVKIMYLDVDKGQDLANYLKITSIPTFISYINKDKADILISADEEHVRKFFRKVEAYNFLK